MLPVAGDQDTEVVGRVDQEFLADAVAARAVQPILVGDGGGGVDPGLGRGVGEAARVLIGQPAVLVRAEQHGARSHLVVQRDIDDRLALDERIVAEGAFDGLGRREGRPLRGDVQRPHFGVAAEQGALGSAQDLEGVDVDQVLQRHARAPLIDPVEIDPHHVVQAVAGGRGDAKPADGQRRVARIADLIEQARGLGDDVRQGDGVLELQRLAADRLHRDRDRLQRL